jgi:hypothetical protein
MSKKTKRKSRMDNPEKLAILGTQDTRRKQTMQKTKKMSNTDTTNIRG